MNLEIYKLEILRRSQERIKRRKRIRNRVLALCIPLAVLVTAVLINPPFMARKDLAAKQETVAEAENYNTGSIFCSFVEAELYVGNETVTVSDKLTVDRLYVIAAFTEKDGGFYYGSAAPPTESVTEPESATESDSDSELIADEDVFYRAQGGKGHIILFTAADGSSKLYALTDEQYEEILEVLE